MSVRRWSTVKKTFESRLAVELQGRLQVHVTGYSGHGRGWIVFDRAEVVSVEAPGFIRIVLGHRFCSDFVDGQTVQLGEACGAFLDLPFKDCLSSINPLIKGLAILDARCGKRSLERLSKESLDSFGATMLAIRLMALGESLSPISCQHCGKILALPSGS